MGADLGGGKTVTGMKSLDNPASTRSLALPVVPQCARSVAGMPADLTENANIPSWPFAGPPKLVLAHPCDRSFER
jgi:hypothetical protein